MYLASKRYDKIDRNVAYVLDAFSDLTFPLDLEKLIRRIPGLYLRYYSQEDAKKREIFRLVSIEGFGLWMSDECYVIFVNDDGNPCRIRFSIAHEIGHFMLGHYSKLKSGVISEDEAESEAHFFAGKLLAPNWAIDLLESKDCVSICKNFEVSYECGIYRLNCYHKWVAKERPLSSIETPLRKRVSFKRNCFEHNNNPYRESQYAE